MAIGAPPLLLLLLAGTAVVGADSGALLGLPGDISQCAIGCIAAAGSPDDCTQLRGVQCMCRDGSVLQAALACVEKRCTSDDMDATLQLFVDSCALLSAIPGLPTASTSLGVTDSPRAPPHTLPLSIIPLPSIRPSTTDGVSVGDESTAMSATATMSNQSSALSVWSATAMPTSDPGTALSDRASQTTPLPHPCSGAASSGVTEGGASTAPGSGLGTTVTFHPTAHSETGIAFTTNFASAAPSHGLSNAAKGREGVSARLGRVPGIGMVLLSIPAMRMALVF